MIQRIGNIFLEDTTSLRSLQIRRIVVFARERVEVCFLQDSILNIQSLRFVGESDPRKDLAQLIVEARGIIVNRYRRILINMEEPAEVCRIRRLRQFHIVIDDEILLIDENEMPVNALDAFDSMITWS